MRSIFRPVRDLLYLFYPHLCLACGKHAPPYEEIICTPCQATLPESDFHLQAENPFTEKFWGRIPLQAGAAMYLFNKQSKIRHLIHNFKYKGKKEIGLLLGRQYGYALLCAPQFDDIDVIVPVPLHWKKERLRGYNQSEMLAIGLSESLEIPLVKDALKRTIHTGTQTRKSRIGRLENMEEVFSVHRPESLKGKHILLVDDVLTTGSTLEACAIEILKLESTKVSMVTLAMAEV